MNILIIGDSWSKPDGYTEPQIPPNFSTTLLPLEYYLMSKGHRVFNRGEGGRGNMNSLRLGTYFVKMANHLGINLDLIIYFNSDLSRDRQTIYSGHWDELTGKTEIKQYPKTLKGISDEIYSIHKQNLDTLRGLHKGKWAVIGGCAPLYNLSDFSFADFIIEDWRSEIIGVDLPECYTVSSVNGSLSWALQGTDNWDVKAQLVEAQEIVIDAMDKSDDFPDCAHPGADAHEKLTNKLHELFQMLP